MFIYEQPLNENMRLFLRLEHLFKQFDEYMVNGSRKNSKVALMTLLQMLNVIDRPDLKSKLNQTLSQQAAVLSQMQQFPQVDLARLRKILHQLEDLMNYLHHIHGRIGEALRKNDFLNQVRSQLNNPAGACDFAVPALMLWLGRSDDQRMMDLKRWGEEFGRIKEVVSMILQLSRDSASAQELQCKDGFYHQALDPLQLNQLLRLKIFDASIFPEFSVGKSRFSIRFLTIHNYCDASSAIQVHSDFPFQLTCCRL